MERNLHITAQGLAERGVAVCLFTADTVMDVGRFEVEGEASILQEVEECDRVGTAGEGHKYSLADQLGEGGQEMFREAGEGHASS
jgi:hypothetical protein